MLITPIMMVAEVVPAAEMQRQYLIKHTRMSIRPGPLRTSSERAQSHVEVQKRDYTPRSMLMATPIIFQVSQLSRHLVALRNPSGS